MVSVLGLAVWSFPFWVEGVGTFTLVGGELGTLVQLLDIDVFVGGGVLDGKLLVRLVVI